MKLGLGKKGGVRALAVLGVVLAGSVYYSFFSDSAPSAPAKTPVAALSDTAPSEEASAPRGRTDEFLPVLHRKNSDGKKGDPISQDPTLRLDLLAKLNGVPAAGSGRDLFYFAPEKLKGTGPVVKPLVPVGPPHLMPAPKVVATGSAPHPTINLKYYGIGTTRADGQKTAFFLDGDDILIVAEGATFKGRYRLLRIGGVSAVVEDLRYKHEQTLPLVEEAQRVGD